MRLRLIWILSVLAATTAAAAQPLSEGAKYVSMGSSFAAGPGVGQPGDTPPTRCARSADNYAHQFARDARLSLVDVACSGASTTHLLGPWNELKAEVSAVDTETRLVTVLIGGNDLGYLGSLTAGSCRIVAADAERAAHCPPSPAAPTDADFATLETRMGALAEEAHRRAPQAELVFVQYFTILPPGAPCAAVALSRETIGQERTLAARLAELTERAAKAHGAKVLPLDTLSADHHACAAEPWVNGYPRPGAPVTGAPYHPNLAGMTAAAAALRSLVSAH